MYHKHFFLQGLKIEHERLKKTVDSIRSEFSLHDPRLQHIVTYMIHCESSNEVVLIMLLEQFAELILLDENEK